MSRRVPALGLAMAQASWVAGASRVEHSHAEEWPHAWRLKTYHPDGSPWIIAAWVGDLFARGWVLTGGKLDALLTASAVQREIEAHSVRAPHPMDVTDALGPDALGPDQVGALIVPVLSDRPLSLWRHLTAEHPGLVGMPTEGVTDIAAAAAHEQWHRTHDPRKGLPLIRSAGGPARAHAHARTWPEWARAAGRPAWDRWVGAEPQVVIRRYGLTERLDNLQA